MVHKFGTAVKSHHLTAWCQNEQIITGATGFTRAVTFHHAGTSAWLAGFVHVVIRVEFAVDQSIAFFQLFHGFLIHVEIVGDHPDRFLAVSQNVDRIAVYDFNDLAG